MPAWRQSWSTFEIRGASHWSRRIMAAKLIAEREEWRSSLAAGTQWRCLVEGDSIWHAELGRLICRKRLATTSSSRSWPEVPAVPRCRKLSQETASLAASSKRCAAEWLQFRKPRIEFFRQIVREMRVSLRFQRVQGSADTAHSAQKALHTLFQGLMHRFAKSLLRR